MARAPIRFSVYISGKLVDDLVVDRPVFDIGKLSTATVRLDDINVSRKHAVVEHLDDGTWRITDLGSTNGTLIGGARIEQAILKDGDRLVIGRTTLVVHIDPAPRAAPASAPTLAVVSGTRVSTPLGPAWTANAATPARRLPRGAAGHVVTIVGALFFLVGTLAMPWQRFDLAGLALGALDTGLLAVLGVLAGGSTLVASALGLATGRRHAAARYNLGALVVVGAWLALAALDPAGDHLMRYEETHLGGGFLVAAWGAVVMLGGAGLVFGALPRWDASTSLLRVLVARAGRPVQDVVVYEPRTLDLGAALPSFTVTREGDVCMRRPGARPEPIRHGARGALDVGDTRVMYLFVRPLAGRQPTALTHWSESAGFGLFALLVALLVGVGAILGLDEEARRDLSTSDPRRASVELVTAEERAAEAAQTIPIALAPPELAEPAATLDDGDRYGDEALADAEALGPDEDRPTRDVVDLLSPRREAPVDLTGLAPDERAERARELAAETALAQALRSDDPLVAALMTIDVDVDARVNILAAIDGQGTFAAGATDPFGGTLTGGGGFPGGPEGTPPGGSGGPDGDGPVIAGLDKRPGRPDLGDIPFEDRPVVPILDERPPVIHGEHDPKLIQQHIRRYLSGIKACYQERLQHDRQLTGRMTLSFTILPSGDVHDARTTDDTLGDALLDQCVVTKMSRWRFPAPRDGGTAEVDYRLILKAR